MSLDYATTLSLTEWRSVSDEACGRMTVSSYKGTDFRANFFEISTGDVKIFKTQTGPQIVRKMPDQINQNTPANCKLYLQLEGESSISQNGRSCTMQPGDLTLFVTDCPYTLDYQTDQQSLIVYFPQRLLRISREQINQMTATPLSRHDPLGNAAVTLFEQLTGDLELLNSLDAECLVKSALSIFVSVLQAKADDVARSITSEKMLFDEAVEFIERNIKCSDLTPRRVAQNSFVSKRYLERVFADHGESVAAYIRQSRLKKLREALGRPENARFSISQLASRFGMDNASYVSRVFRDAYDVSPTVYRRKMMNR